MYIMVQSAPAVCIIAVTMDNPNLNHGALVLRAGMCLVVRAVINIYKLEIKHSEMERETTMYVCGRLYNHTYHRHDKNEEQKKRKRYIMALV